jgi:hypothetical protein
LFGGNRESLDYSEEAAYAQFFWESTGRCYTEYKVPEGKSNGYTVGKHWMDVTIANWLHDIMDGLLFMHELYEDPEFSDYHWWLDRTVKEAIKSKLASGEKLNLWWKQ